MTEQPTTPDVSSITTDQIAAGHREQPVSSYVVAVGDPFDGLELYGIFDTASVVDTWIGDGQRAELRDQTWWIVPVRQPADQDTVELFTDAATLRLSKLLPEVDAASRLIAVFALLGEMRQKYHEQPEGIIWDAFLAASQLIVDRGYPQQVFTPAELEIWQKLIQMGSEPDQASPPNPQEPTDDVDHSQS